MVRRVPSNRYASWSTACFTWVDDQIWPSRSFYKTYKWTCVDDQCLYLRSPSTWPTKHIASLLPLFLILLPSSTMASSDYMIYRPEKVGYLDLLRLCLFERRPSDCKFVESSHSQGSKLENESAIADWTVGFTLIIQKILLLLDVPLRSLGFIIKFSLNLLSLNGGFLRLIFRIITCRYKDSITDIWWMDNKYYVQYISSVTALLHLCLISW